MGVERLGLGGVGRREQAHFAQPRDGAPPCVVAEVDDRIGEPWDRRLGAQRHETIAARWPVEQADA